MTFEWEKILAALGSAGSQTTVASLALLFFFYLRRQEKELREENNKTIRTLQRERRALRKEIAELDQEIEQLQDELDKERAARRAAENDAHAAGHLRVVEGGNVG